MCRRSASRRRRCWKRAGAVGASALAEAVQRCIDDDGAEAVIIGGGPLGQAAIALGDQFDVPLVAPISAAMRLLLSRLAVAS